MSGPTFDEVVRTHGPALARVAWGYASNTADHDDLLQDILVAIWFALPRFRAESSLRTFVFRIAHNRGCAWIARRGADVPLTPDLALADPRPAPDEAIDADAGHARLAAAIRRLPDAQRQAVLLRLEGFDIAEIAELQQTTANNVSVRLSRARDRLRELLGGEDR